MLGGNKLHGINNRDMKSFKELNNEFDISKEMKKNIIKIEPNRFKRMLMWLWYFISFPFSWVWVNIRDWKTAVIFGLTVLIVSSEVWLLYLIYFITGNQWCLGVGSACLVFWLGPGTPFIVLCIGITMGIKALLNKII